MKDTTKLTTKMKGVLTQNPRWNLITGSPTATILLHQIAYWNKKKKGEFYKFKEKCRHPRYKDGDSWTEELCLTRRQFDGALKKIGTRISKGVSLREARDGWKTKKYIKIEELVKSLVLYWKDGEKLQWYSLNTELFDALLEIVKVQNRLSIYKAQNALSIYNEHNRLSIITENTPETTAEITYSGFLAKPVVHGKAIDSFDDHEGTESVPESLAVSSSSLSLLGSPPAEQVRPESNSLGLGAKNLQQQEAHEQAIVYSAPHLNPSPQYEYPSQYFFDKWEAEFGTEYLWPDDGAVHEEELNMLDDYVTENEGGPQALIDLYFLQDFSRPTNFRVKHFLSENILRNLSEKMRCDETMKKAHHEKLYATYKSQ